MTNGNGWTKWLAGLIWVVIFTAMTTLTTNMVANRNHQLRADERLSDELRNNDKELRDCVDKKILQVKQEIKESISEIKEGMNIVRLEQKAIRTEQYESGKIQVEMMTILKRLDKKDDN